MEWKCDWASWGSSTLAVHENPGDLTKPGSHTGPADAVWPLQVVLRLGITAVGNLESLQGLGSQGHDQRGAEVSAGQ